MAESASISGPERRNPLISCPPETDIDLTDCLLNHMEISVSESEKRATSALNIRDHYTVYLIDTRICDNMWGLSEKGLGQIWRRYSEFEQLRHYLSSVYPWAVLPPLPEKRHTFPAHNPPADTFDPDFVDRRRASLENFLHRLASHPIISHDPVILMFLQEEEAWRNTIKDKGYMQLAEDKLKSLSAVVRVKDPDPKFDSFRKNSNEIKVCLTNVLRIRAKIASRIHNIHKLHASYGKLFSEWSAIEKDMGDSLQRAGHYFDSISSTIGTALEDEEQIVDQLKEYLYYCNSIEDLCNKRDILQLQLEKMHDIINIKHTEKEKILQGRTGVMSRLFGSTEPEDSRGLKLDGVQQKIADIEDNIKTQQDTIGEFGAKSSADLDRFQEQKIKDLTETLESLVKLQLKVAKKNLQAWTNVKACINSIPT